MSELEKVFAKADKAKEMFTFPKINKKISAKQMRDGKTGLFLNGKVYPVARKLTKNIAFVNSIRGKKNQKVFAELLLKLQKVKSESDRKKTYQTFLQETQNIPLNVSEFLYEYSNARLPADIKTKYGKVPELNLYTPDETLMIRIASVLKEVGREILKAPPPEQKSEEEMKMEPAEPSKRLRKTTFIEKKEKSAREKRAEESSKPSKASEKQKSDKTAKKDEPERQAKATPTPRKLRGNASQREEREVAVDAEGDVEREPRAELEAGGFMGDSVDEAEFEAEMAQEAREEAEGKRQDAEPMLQREGPPPPEPRPNIQMDIEEKKDDSKSADRQTELNRASAEAEGKREEMEKDSEPDISKHGHQLAIQNVFIKNGKDFSFIKKQLARSLFINKSNKSIKQEIDLIYAYYSSLFPLTAKKEYSKENHLELKTLEFQYKRNIQFERSWKKNLATLRMPSMGGGGQQRGQNVGIIVNTEGMGMNAGQFFQQSSQTPPTQAGAVPQEPAPAPLNNPTQTQGSANPQSVMTKPTKQTSGGAALSDIKKEKIIPQTQRINPKSSRKREKRVKRQEINLVVRQKVIKPNLLFTNPRVRQRIPEPEGELPLFTFRSKNKNRIKL